MLGSLNGILGTVGAMLYPAAVFNDHVFGLFEPHEPGFGWFVAYAIGSGAFFTTSWAALAVHGVDPGERARALMSTIAVPVPVFALA